MSEGQTAAVEPATQVTPDAIMQLGLAFWGSKTLLSAVEVGVFSELADAGALDGEVLRKRLSLHPRSASDFFDALVALGMLERDEGRYANTPATELFLDRGKPSYPISRAELADMHGNDERISVRRLEEGTDMLTRVLRAVAAR